MNKIQLFPMMIFAVVVFFGIKSYDLAMGLDSTKTDTLAASLNSIETAAGQQDAAEDASENEILESVENSDYTPSGLPYTGEEMQFNSELPEDLQQVIEKWESYAKNSIDFQ